jgi:hypothetical protein
MLVSRSWFLCGLILVLNLSALAQARPPICLAGDPRSSQLHNRLMNTRLTANFPAVMSLIQYYKKDELENAVRRGSIPTSSSFRSSSDTRICKASSAKENQRVNIHSLRALVDRALQPKHLAIQSTCILASLKRSGPEAGYFCPTAKGPGKILGNPGGSRAACISSELANYTTWAFNKAVACMNNPQRPLDPSLLFQKFNNESGFNYFVGYEGGMGIGGMTSIAVKELNLNSNVFTQVFNPLKPDCVPFAQAMKNKPNNVFNRCEWLDMEEGLARSLIYSIGLFLHIRDNQLSSLRDDFERANLEDYRALNLATLAIYGPEGLAAKRDISAILKSKPRNFGEFKQRLFSRVPYLRHIDSKSAEVLRMTSPPKKHAEECYGTQ